MSRTLTKQPMPRSHFAAARATSGNRLRFALRNIRPMARSNVFSPSGSAVHHSGTASRVMREA